MTSESKTPLRRVVALSMAVLAGYVTVLSTGPVAANVRLTQITPDSALWYSIMAASGAVVAAISFIVFGRISNRLLETRGSRQSIFIFAAIALAPTALLLSVADSLPTILALWCFIQIPSAALLSAATAVVLELVPERLVGLASGLFGAAAVLAIFFGVAVGTVFRNDPTPVLFVGLAMATLLATPAALTREQTALRSQVTETKHSTRTPRTFWIFLFAASASLAASTLSTDYYYQLVLRILDQDAAQAAAVTQAIYPASASAFLVASIAGGLIAKKAKPSIFIFTYSLPITAAGVLLVSFSQNITLLFVGAIVTGLSTGFNVGSQFPLLRITLQGRQELGREAGIYNLTSMVPSILVPAFGALLISGIGADWPLVLGSVIAALALTGAALARTIRIR